MANPVKTQAATVKAVRALIGEAAQAQNTMYAKCKEAAKLAAQLLDPKKPFKTRVDDVVKTYADDFKAAGHNVRALFVDALTILAATSEPVHVEVAGAPKPVEMLAGEALESSQRAMKSAARQVREAQGVARAPGAGRTKTKAEQVAAAVGEAPTVTVTRSEVDAFSAWIENLEPYFTDAVYHQKIVARLIEMGFTVSKAAKGKVVKGVASA